MRAFSLVELSIVLVILGLLTGGILAGQSLIHAAELRAVITEYQRYIAATQSFRDKYMALPGDMRNASSFWGLQDPSPATCGITASTTTATCNGNGDGLLSSAFNNNEIFRFWQHLSNAGLIEGQFTGISSSATVTYRASLSTNIPASKFGLAGWVAFDYNVGSQMFDPLGGNNLFFGGAGNFTSVGIMSTEDAWNIDTKLDDGTATHGRVATWKSSINACASNDTQDAVYRLTSTGDDRCALIFRNVF